MSRTFASAFIVIEIIINYISADSLLLTFQWVTLALAVVSVPVVADFAVAGCALTTTLLGVPEVVRRTGLGAADTRAKIFIPDFVVRAFDGTALAHAF